MATPGARARSVFVGNIPYDAHEEALIDIFKEVGPVVSFRLVFDKETGKPKGFGFCEYRDKQTALSAQRNLNGRDFNGRQLRVGFADNDSNKNNDAGDSTKDMESEVKVLLDQMSTSQLYEVMVQLKGLMQQNPAQVRTLLQEKPQFTYALLQAQVLLGMVSPDVVDQFTVAQTNGPNTAQSSHPQQRDLRQQQQHQQQQQQQHAPPPQQQQMPGGVAAANQNAVQQAAILQQVMALTMEQINRLPPAERQQVMTIRNSVTAQIGNL
eukprot:TRINITY_DN12447_c0_g1_i1.p1 TRINITY_DN12447_c0_g1~~TRINITY_DN12447_c0_g1_i1.p1  ORF type:complete len:276 (+),score=62.84 TRINITY_DN12447_c0_g1_i1:29-829(+)